MSDSYDDYETKIQLAEHAWEEHVDEMVKTEHDKQIEIAQAYERGWNAALAQQEPVAWISEGGDVSRSKRYMDEMGFKCNPLYTAPPKKQWVGLTAYEIQEIHSGNQHWGDFACAIEAKLREKNHG
jgi:hypothetical protein